MNVAGWFAATGSGRARASCFYSRTDLPSCCACRFSPAPYAEWLGRYLGPKLRSVHPNVKIMVWDHNRAADVVSFANAIAQGGYTHYADLVAWHW